VLDEELVPREQDARRAVGVEVVDARVRHRGEASCSRSPSSTGPVPKAQCAYGFTRPAGGAAAEAALRHGEGPLRSSGTSGLPEAVAHLSGISNRENGVVPKMRTRRQSNALRFQALSFWFQKYPSRSSRHIFGYRVFDTVSE